MGTHSKFLQQAILGTIVRGSSATSPLNRAGGGHPMDALACEASQPASATAFRPSGGAAGARQRKAGLRRCARVTLWLVDGKLLWAVVTCQLACRKEWVERRRLRYMPVANLNSRRDRKSHRKYTDVVRIVGPRGSAQDKTRGGGGRSGYLYVGSAFRFSFSTRLPL